MSLVVSSAGQSQPPELSSYPRLVNFFKGKKEIGEISLLAKDEKKLLLANRWQVSCILAPLLCSIYTLTSLFICILGNVVGCIGISSLQKRCIVLSKHFKANAAEASLFSRFIGFSRNMHALDSADFYLRPEIPTKSLKDPQIIDVTFFRSHGATDPLDPLVRNIIFYHGEGICRGMSNWFMHLYLKTVDKFKNPAAHLAAVTKIVGERGASPQAALLQSFSDEAALLKMKTTYSTVISHRMLNEKDQKKSLAALSNLPPGAYGVGLYHHRINYIKVHDELGFIFNPSKGLLRCEGKEHAKKALDHFLEYHHVSEPNSCVELNRYECV